VPVRFGLYRLNCSEHRPHMHFNRYGGGETPVICGRRHPWPTPPVYRD
jgi:hypothetical protein